MTRYRDLGLDVGLLPTGPGNAITDVEGVKVGLVTLIEGDGPLVIGSGPVRTGVTAIVPHDDIGELPLFAGCHRLNGNGELTGLEWVRESGQLTTPIAITNTHSVGVVRDAIVAADVRRREVPQNFWSLPVVGETYDGTLNDINGFHVAAEHLDRALAAAAGGAVAEGNVGGGTGMICHEFKGGTGTASRTVNGYVVGALVQANHGRRARLAVDGVPVGRELGMAGSPAPTTTRPRPGAVRSSRSWRPTRRCSRISASASRSAPASASLVPAAAASIPAGICSSPSPPANRGRVTSYKEDAPPVPAEIACCPTPVSPTCSGPRSRPPRRRSSTPSSPPRP